jgi:PKD repeat protein
MRIAANSAAVDCAVCYVVYDNTPQPPIADFGADATTILPGGTVNFSDMSAYNPTSWSWTFEGGSPSTSTAQNPSVTYDALGTYTVTLTATNDLGSDTETKTAYINVVDEIIDYCASAGGNSSHEWIAGVQVGDFSNTSGAAGYTDFTDLTANLTAGQTYNITLTPDFGGRPYSEYWKIWIDLNRDGDFNDANENVFDAGGLSKRVVNGTITIPASTSQVTTRMRVSMKYNGAQTACETFGYGEVEDYTVNITGDEPNLPPVAEANGPYNGDEDVAISFSSAGSNDPDGTIESYHWDFGDGGTSTAANPSYTYSDPGTYTVELTVTDDRGATNTDQATATIANVNEPPVADAGGPYSGIVGEVVNFDGTGSSDPDGDALTYDWNFGDGATGTGATPTHTYIATGTYTATLTVSDGTFTDQATATVTITEQQQEAIMSSAISIYTYQQGPFNKATATVTITSEGQPVSEALVEGYWSGSVSSSASGLTLADGTIAFNEKTKSGDTFIFTITAVTKTGYVWDGLNNTVSNKGRSFIQSTEMKVYPNPANNRISVSITGYDNAQLMIYDVAGNQIRNITMDRSLVELDISDLQNGMYFMIINDGQEVISKRFIKQ